MVTASEFVEFLVDAETDMGESAAMFYSCEFFNIEIEDGYSLLFEASGKQLFSKSKNRMTPEIQKLINDNKILDNGFRLIANDRCADALQVAVEALENALLENEKYKCDLGVKIKYDINKALRKIQRIAEQSR